MGCGSSVAAKDTPAASPAAAPSSPAKGILKHKYSSPTFHQPPAEAPSATNGQGGSEEKEGASEDVAKEALRVDEPASTPPSQRATPAPAMPSLQSRDASTGSVTTSVGIPEDASSDEEEEEDDDDEYDFVTESDSDEEADAGGRSIDGRYLLVKKIGEGATASAHLCLDLAGANRPVIVKNTEKKKFRAIPQPGLARAKSKAVLQGGPMAEIAVLKKLSHSNVIKLFNVFDDPGSPYVSLVLEYASGGDLGEKIKKGREDNNSGGLAVHPQQLWSWCRDVVCGVAYLHKQGVMHRDLKPDNILLDMNDNAKLADFGASTFVRGEGDDMVTDIAGTPAYMSPECVKGDPYFGFAADIWAIGMTMYHCLFGDVAFKAANNVALYKMIESQEVRYPEEGMSDLEDSLKALLRRCLERDPKKRITAREMLHDEWLTNNGASPLTDWKMFRRVKVTGSNMRNAVQAAGNAASLVGESNNREERVLEAGDTLTKQGDVAMEAYFIQEGTAAVYLETNVDMNDIGTKEASENGTTQTNEIESQLKRDSRLSASEKRKIQEVGAGEFIGEVALCLEESPLRTASVIAMSRMRVTVIRKEDLQSYFKNDPAAEERMKLKAKERQAQRQALAGTLKSQLELKLGLGLENLPTLNENLPRKVFSTGAVITSQGERSEMVWFIRRGTVKTVSIPPGKNLKDAILFGKKEAGQFIGEVAILLDEEKRLTTTVAESPCELIGIQKPLFLQLVGSNPVLMEKMREWAFNVKTERRNLVRKKLQAVSMKTMLETAAASVFRQGSRKRGVAMDGNESSGSWSPGSPLSPMEKLRQHSLSMLGSAASVFKTAMLNKNPAMESKRPGSAGSPA